MAIPPNPLRSTPYLDGYAHWGMMKAVRGCLLLQPALLLSCPLYHSSYCRCRCCLAVIPFRGSPWLDAAGIAASACAPDGNSLGACPAALPPSPAGALVCEAQAAHAARAVRQTPGLRPAVGGPQPRRRCGWDWHAACMPTCMGMGGGGRTAALHLAAAPCSAYDARRTAIVLPCPLLLHGAAPPPCRHGGAGSAPDSAGRP